MGMIHSQLLSSLIIYVIVLLSMSFFTLLERKVLGYIQLRKGPNKVGFIGILQPFSDALKLFRKELNFPVFSNLVPFLISPMAGLFLALGIWFIYPRRSCIYIIYYRVLLFLCISSLNVYTTLIAGWSSNSKYSLLGSLRGVAQTISYEVRMSLTLLRCLITFGRLNFIYIYIYRYGGIFFLCIPLFLI